MRSLKKHSLGTEKIIGRLLQSVFAMQVGTTTLSQAVTLSMSLIIAAITARWLGPAGKGQLAMIFMVPSTLQMLFSVGLGPANVYYTGLSRLPIQQLSANSTMFSLIGSVIGILVIVPILMSKLLHIFFPGISSSYFMLGMIALPLSLLNSNQRAILQGLQHIFTLNIISVIGPLITAIFLVMLVIGLECGITGAILATLAGQGAMLLATGWCIRREGAHFRPKWKPQIVKPTLSYGMKCYVANLFQFFNYRLDMFIVNFYLGPVGVGIYGVSVVLAELLWQIPNAAGFVIFPKSASSTQEVMNRFTPQVFWIILCCSLLGAIGLALFGKIAIRLIFSSAFLDAYAPLLILLPGVVLLGAGKILTNDIAGRGYPHYNSITAGIALIVTVVLDVIFIPKMGVRGAALATTLAYTLIFLFSVGFYISVDRKTYYKGE